MCSCVVASPTSRQYITQPIVEERCSRKSQLNFSVLSPLSSPSISSRRSSNSDASSWVTRLHRHHYDVAVRVMMKKHECQFKISPGELQTHLHAIFKQLRAQDNIKLAVRLESWNSDHRRYLVIISTTGRQDSEESIIIGCDFAKKTSTTCTIGLVLPVWCDTVIRLDGDGGFVIECKEKKHTFKPVSVQAMWSALQALHRCVDVAGKMNYYEGSLFLTWTGFYSSKITSDRLHINEWYFTEDLEARKDYFEKSAPERLEVEILIRSKLKEVMSKMDLDNTTSRDIRNALEGAIDMDLREYKEYIDTEMLIVVGQMDCASKILDYLYLGSEWNACNLEELEEIGITHILNITIEAANFYPEHFCYKSVKLLDLPTSNLLPHWNHTWKFIDEAKKSGGKCFVHCKKGISRSAATVTAYIMKEKMWRKKEALKYVETCRSIVCPNPGFQKQLDEYEGILFASAQRHNKLFRSRSESSLSEPSVASDEQRPSTVNSPRINLPQIEVEEESINVPMETEQFDLNRHLLDIATLSTPKISRPKSWSPDEGRTCYDPNKGVVRDPAGLDVLGVHEVNNENYRPKNMSEPGELLSAACGDPGRVTKAEKLRKDLAYKRAHLRRHTAAESHNVLPLDELAHSEDSVFVHDGTLANVSHRNQSKGNTNQIHRKNITSSPASFQSTVQYRPDTLSVQGDNDHSSKASSLISPSYKMTQNIDVSVLKSRFCDSDCDAKMSKPLNLDDSASENEGSGSECSTGPIKSSVPVREIVAVIESPSEDGNRFGKLGSSGDLRSLNKSPDVFVKSHHKTASLPPANIDSHKNSYPSEVQDRPRNDEELMRSRSYSETQAFSVKKIVTEIESRSQLEEEDGSTQSNDVLHRTMSMPSRARNSASPLSCSFVPVTESSKEDEEINKSTLGSTPANVSSSFYIGDAHNNDTPIPSSDDQFNNNNNNNSNNNNNNNKKDLEVDHLASREHITKVIATNDARRTLPVKIEELPDFEEVQTNSQEKRVCHLSSDVLHVIREVGMQLMSDSEESNFSLSARNKERDERSTLSDESQPENSSHSSVGKRRGIVRQMAREIERRVRKLTGRTPKAYSKSTGIQSPPSATNSVINQLLMGESPVKKNAERRPSCPAWLISSPEQNSKQDLSPLTSKSAEVNVRHLVDKFDSPSTSSCAKMILQTEALPSSPETHVSLSQSGAKDITSLVTPPPYRPSFLNRGNSPSPPSVRKFQWNVKSSRVRRSQSERTGIRPVVSKQVESAFQPFKAVDDRKLFSANRNSNSQPELSGEGGGSLFQSPLKNPPTPSSGLHMSNSSDSEDSSRPDKGDQNLDNSFLPPVRDVIRNIELRKITRSYSVQRSSSMPSSSLPRASIIRHSQPPLKVLRKTKSTPFLDVIWSSPLKSIRWDKKK